MIIIEKRMPVSDKKDKYSFKNTLGYLNEKVARKEYMQPYHCHHEYEVIYDETMDGLFGGKNSFFRNVGRAFGQAGRMVSKAVKDIAKMAAPVMKVVEGIGEVTQDAYDAAKEVAMKVSPPFLRPFIEVAIAPISLVVHPEATISAIVKTAGEIAHDIVKETSNATEVVYKQVTRPAFRIVRNVVNETVWQPIHKVVDVAVLPILPKSIRDRVGEIIDIPDAAFRGKLTDKDVVAGVKAYMQLAILPTKIGGQLANDVVDRLKKDAILGPFINGLDKYSGGLLTSAHNLADMPDDIYHDRVIDIKARMIDALKIYLATISVNALISNMSTGYVGTETGLNQTPLGRGVLTVGAAYGGAYASGSLANLSGQAFKDASNDLLVKTSKDVAVNQAKNEAIKEALKKGWVDDAFTARMILSAGGTMYSATGSEKTLMQAMDEVHDKEFQKYINHEIQNRTGLPVTYAHLTDIYNTDWASIAENVNKAMSKLVPTIGTADGDFLSQMGSNFVDEMRRVPANFSNISQNVLDELARSPENLAKLASAVSKEAVRTPENIAKIATDIANASVKASQDAATAISKAAQDAANEAARTPDNIVDFVSSVKAPDISAPKLDMPKIDLPKVDLDALVQKYGPLMIQLLTERHGPNYAQMDFTPEELSNIEIEFNNRQKKSKAPLIIGVLGLLAAGYVASQD